MAFSLILTLKRLYLAISSLNGEFRKAVRLGDFKHTASIKHNSIEHLQGSECRQYVRHRGLQ